MVLPIFETLFLDPLSVEMIEFLIEDLSSILGMVFYSPL